MHSRNRIEGGFALALPGIFQNNSPWYSWYDQSCQESQRAKERREDNNQRRLGDFNSKGYPASRALADHEEGMMVFSPSEHRRQYILQTSNVLEISQSRKVRLLLGSASRWPRLVADSHLGLRNESKGLVIDLCLPWPSAHSALTAT